MFHKNPKFDIDRRFVVTYPFKLSISMSEDNVIVTILLKSVTSRIDNKLSLNCRRRPTQLVAKNM